MKKILLVLVLWWHVTSAQNYPITWGPLERSNGYLIDILPKNDLDFNRVEVNGERNSTEIKANISNSVGDLGQYVIGTFLATGNTQEIKFLNLQNMIPILILQPKL